MSSPPAFRKTVITRLFDASPKPAYVLDGRRRVVYANQALADWLGVARDSLAGVICDYVADSNSPVAGLCAPPSAFAGQGSDGLVHSPKASNQPLAVQFTPIHGDKDAGEDVLGVLVTVVVPKPVALPESAVASVEERLHDVLIQSRRRDGSAAGVLPLVGVSPAIRRARRQFNIAVEAVGSVLVCASSSSVAERIARAIHARRHPDGEAGLVPLACPLLDAELVRTTLTAFIQRCAELKTELPPTLLLLEVEQLSEDAQRELSGFLAIDELALQTLATSTRPFAGLARGANQEGGLRDDLAAALSTLEIVLPRLKDRPVDVPLVVQAALESHNVHLKNQLEGFDSSALEQLISYPWPGDLTEVEETIAKSVKKVVTSGTTHIAVDDLPREIRLGLDAVALPSNETSSVDLDTLLFDIERELVSTTLQQTRQNRAEAARRLGISRNKLLRRIAHLGLDDGAENGN